jgi:hypothetical protein
VVELPYTEGAWRGVALCGIEMRVVKLDTTYQSPITIAFILLPQNSVLTDCINLILYPSHKRNK